MNKMVLFLFSFIAFMLFLILMFQNVGNTAYKTTFNVFIGSSYMTPGVVLGVGFLFGILVAIPMLIFVKSGGNVKTSSGSETSSSSSNLEWD